MKRAKQESILRGVTVFETIQLHRREPHWIEVNVIVGRSGLRLRLNTADRLRPNSGDEVEQLAWNMRESMLALYEALAPGFGCDEEQRPS